MDYGKHRRHKSGLLSGSKKSGGKKDRKDHRKGCSGPTFPFSESSCSSHSSSCSSSSSSCCEPCCPSCPTGPTGPRGGGLVGIPDWGGNGGDGPWNLCENPDLFPNPLDRDYYFTTLTVCGELCTGGFRIFAQDQIIMQSQPGVPAVICNDGGTCGARSGTVGGGTQGGHAPYFRGENSCCPNIGGRGGNGQFPAGELFPFPPSSGGVGVYNASPNHFTGRDLDGVRSMGGTGGGGDDGSGTGVGAGGGGAGVIILTTPTMSGTGIIRARGGDGQNTGRTGGGGGGAVIINLLNEPALTTNIDINVDGGAPGQIGASPGQVGSFYRNI